MERFLVLQMCPVDGKNGETSVIEEPVIDFATYEDAEKWINEQDEPSLFTVEDQLKSDFTEGDDYDSTYIDFYNYSSSADDDYDLPEDDGSYDEYNDDSY